MMIEEGRLVPDTVLHNAHVITLDGVSTIAEAIAIEGDRIVAVGTDADVLPLAAIPPLLQRAFILSEDQHFYVHHGIDWTARLAAVWQNAKAAAVVRGASSITEQTVRILHPRPRNLWSRWLESFEASRLESRFSKAQILAFYLNQVPYADRRRGVAQAARLYFDRGPDTLSAAEQLSLAVLVRSPNGMDLRRSEPRAVVLCWRR